MIKILSLIFIIAMISVFLSNSSNAVSTSVNLTITTNPQIELGANNFAINWTLKSISTSTCADANTALKQSGILESGNHTQTNCDYSGADDNEINIMGMQQNASTGTNGFIQNVTGLDILYLNFTARLNASANMGASSVDYGAMDVIIGINISRTYIHYLMLTDTSDVPGPPPVPANTSTNCYLEINSTPTEVSTVQRYSRNLTNDINSCTSGNVGWKILNITTGSYIDSAGMTPGSAPRIQADFDNVMILKTTTTNVTLCTVTEPSTENWTISWGQNVECRNADFTFNQLTIRGNLTLASNNTFRFDALGNITVEPGGMLNINFSNFTPTSVNYEYYNLSSAGNFSSNNSYFLQVRTIAVQNHNATFYNNTIINTTEFSATQFMNARSVWVVSNIIDILSGSLNGIRFLNANGTYANNSLKGSDSLTRGVYLNDACNVNVTNNYHSKETASIEVLRGCNLLIQDNVISNTISLLGATHTFVKNNTIISSGNGIETNNNANNLTIEYNTVRNCRASGSDLAGIKIASGINTIIKNNNVTGMCSGRYGILLFSGGGSHNVYGNNIYNTSSSGISMEQLSNVTYNIVNLSDSHLIEISANYARMNVSHNILWNAEDNGIDIINSDTSVLFNNTVRNVTHGIHSQANTVDTNITNSSFYNVRNWTMIFYRNASEIGMNVSIGTESLYSTKINFTLTDVGFVNVTNPPATPNNYLNTTLYLNITNTTASNQISYMLISFHYDNRYVKSANETNLTLWRYDGFSWILQSGYYVDTSLDTISANLTNLSTGSGFIFGVFENITPIQVGGGGDTLAPRYIFNTSNVSTKFDPNVYSYFNVTWFDDDTQNIQGYANATFEINYTGTFINYTTQRINNQSVFWISNFGAGTYGWRMCANDTASNYNCTLRQTFTVDNADNIISLFINNSRSNRTTQYPQVTNETVFAPNATLGGPAPLPRLYRNNTEIGSAGVLEESEAGGMWNFTGISEASANVSNNNTGETWYLFVQTAPSILEGRTNTTLNSDLTVEYPTKLNISYSNITNASGIFGDLFVNWTSRANPLIDTLGGGVWNVSSNFSGNVNYSANFSYFIITVNRAPNIVSLFINNSRSNLTITYGSATNVTTFAPNGTIWYLNRNGTTLSNQTIEIEAGGVWNFTGYASGNQNYSDNVTGGETWYLTVNTANSILEGRTNTTINNNLVVTYPTKLNISYTNNSVFSDMFINYVTYTNPYIDILGAGQWNVSSNFSGNTNYSANFSYFLISVERGNTSMQVFLNGTQGNRTYTTGDDANFTTLINVSGLSIRLNATLPIFTEQTGTTSILNNTNLTTAGTYNISGYFFGNTNYTSSITTWYAIVSDVGGAGGGGGGGNTVGGFSKTDIDLECEERQFESSPLSCNITIFSTASKDNQFKIILTRWLNINNRFYNNNSEILTLNEPKVSLTRFYLIPKVNATLGIAYASIKRGLTYKLDFETFEIKSIDTLTEKIEKFKRDIIMGAFFLGVKCKPLHIFDFEITTCYIVYLIFFVFILWDIFCILKMEFFRKVTSILLVLLFIVHGLAILL